jgi:hypothetical protein
MSVEDNCYLRRFTINMVSQQGQEQLLVVGLWTGTAEVECEAVFMNKGALSDNIYEIPIV